MSKKISELDPVNDLFEGCCFPLVQNDETRKVTYEVLKNKIETDISTFIDTKIDTKILNKVDKEIGKGLSSNDFTDEYKEKLDEIPDTYFANGADYAEIATWDDENPNKENRLHRFVTLKASGRRIGIANSTDQIVGVTSSHAAFVGNAKDYDEKDMTKAIVGIIGVVSVKTNDNTIQANDRVISDDNGYAVKSSNNCGYRVLEVVNEGLLEIVVSPNTDMIQRIKTDMIEVQELISRIPKFKIEVVDELPTKGDDATVYLVTSGEDEPNLYDEYIYVNNKWEKLGTQKIDLTDYVKNTDYANGAKAGVIKTGVGTQTTATGFLSSVIYDYETYKTRGADTFIGKGTLENVITGKNLANKDDVKNYVDSLDSEEVSY